MIRIGLYRHYKGSVYKVLYIATHTETMEKLVVYKAFDAIKNDIWVRPLIMFNENVEYNGKVMRRFEFMISQNSLDNL